MDSLILMDQDDTVSSTLHRGVPFVRRGHTKDWDLTSRLPEIRSHTVPGGILLLNGETDFVDDESMAGQAGWSTEPEANVEWVRCAESSYVAHLEEPDKFLSVLGEFLTARSH